MVKAKPKNQGKMGSALRWYVEYEGGVAVTHANTRKEAKVKAENRKLKVKVVHPAPPRDQETYPLQENLDTNVQTAMIPPSLQKKSDIELERKKDTYRRAMQGKYGQNYLDTVVVIPNAHGEGVTGFKAALLGVETIVGGEDLRSFINLHFGKDWWSKKSDDRHWIVIRNKNHEKKELQAS